MHYSPYGYVNARDADAKPILTIDEDKAYVVRLVYRQFLSGMQMEEIRRSVKANGMKLTSGSAIRRILSNSLYAGIIHLPQHGTNAPKTIRALHAPIISENDYWLAQDKLTGKTRANQRKEDVYLSGLLHCHCGLKLTSDKSRGKSGKQYRYYVCKKYRKGLSAINLHKQMNEIMKHLALPAELLENIRDRLKNMLDQKLSNKGGDLMRAKLNLQKIKDKISSVEEKYLLQEGISAATYKKIMNELKADEQRLQSQIAELSSSSKNMYSIMDELLPKLSNTAEIFANWPLYKQQAFLKLVFGNSLSYRDKIYRTPFLHPLFAHSELILKEKGLLVIEKSFSDLGDIPGRSPSGSLIEHLTELWQLFAA